MKYTLDVTVYTWIVSTGSSEMDISHKAVMDSRR